jgi:hypothetical protein
LQRDRGQAECILARPDLHSWNFDLCSKRRCLRV